MNTFKMTKNFLIRYYKRLLSAVIVVVFGFILLAASLYNVKLKDGSYKKDDWTSAPYAASTYTGQANVSNNGITTDQSAQELWNKMIEEGSNVEDYLDSPEELERLMNAEIITQYPKIGQGDLDGIIEFERHKTDGTSSMLTYVDSETFNNYINSGNKESLNYFTLDEQGNVLIAIENTTIEEIITNDTEMNISEYTSTLSDTDKQKDGSYKKSQSVLTVMNPPINYKNIVQKYTMPFQYLWSLLVITDDKDFVLELTDLIEDSEIIISIYDNIKTREIIDEYTYYKENRIDTYAKVLAKNNFGVQDYPKERYWLSEDSPEANEHYDAKYTADYSKDAQEYTVKRSVKYENNTPIIDVTRANTWIVDYSKEYTYQAAENTSNNVNEKEIENTEYVEMTNSPDTLENNKLLLNNLKAKSLQSEAKQYIEKNKKSADKSTNSLFSNIQISSNNNNKVLFDNAIDSDDDEEVEVNIVDVKCRYYTHKIEGKQKTTENDTEQKYISGPTKNNPKVEKDSNEENFVKILCSKEHKSAKKNIQEISSWLFELLEINDDTKNMVDLTRYLLYKVTGKDYGVTEYDFNVYEENHFSSITSSGTDISLISTMFTKEVFVQALTEYSNSGVSGSNKTNFDKNFLSRAEEIYDLGVENNINPELIVTMALKESGFNDEGTNNFWGLETPNGAAKKVYSSFEEAVKKLASTFAAYLPGGEKSAMIENRAAERQAAGCNPNGYGNAGTMKGMLSVYSDLCGSDTKHREGNSGDGGNYYLKVIYGSEFGEKCGSIHKIGVDDYTIQEKADYTAWLYEKQLSYWNNIFGKFGKLSSGNTEQIQNMIDRAIEIANDDSHGYVWGAAGPQNFDCSGFMQYLYREYCGIEIPRSSEQQCKYGESQNTEIPSFTTDNKNFNDLQAGDLLWVSGHVGMYIGDGKFVHAASTDIGIVVANLNSYQKNSQKPFTKAFRIVK